MNNIEDKMEMALRRVNASCLFDISKKTLVGCVKGLNDDARWRAHIISFLEELPVELIHDIVLSGIFTFNELSDAIGRRECTDGPTTLWIKEMAALGPNPA